MFFVVFHARKHQYHAYYSTFTPHLSKSLLINWLSSSEDDLSYLLSMKIAYPGCSLRSSQPKQKFPTPPKKNKNKVKWPTLLLMGISRTPPKK